MKQVAPIISGRKGTDPSKGGVFFFTTTEKYTDGGIGEKDVLTSLLDSLPEAVFNWEADQESGTILQITIPEDNPIGAFLAEDGWPKVSTVIPEDLISVVPEAKIYTCPRMTKRGELYFLAKSRKDDDRDLIIKGEKQTTIMDVDPENFLNL